MIENIPSMVRHVPIITSLKFIILSLLKNLKMGTDKAQPNVANTPMKRVPTLARISATFPSLPSVKISLEKKTTAFMPVVC